MRKFAVLNRRFLRLATDMDLKIRIFLQKGFDIQKITIFANRKFR